MFLNNILKLSFSTGVVPSQFKIAKVIPIFKAGSKSSVDNYRPISLLSSFSKIMEKIIASRPLYFLDSNNILSKWHFLKKVTESLNKKTHTISIFCDLKKAFDT